MIGEPNSDQNFLTPVEEESVTKAFPTS